MRDQELELQLVKRVKTGERAAFDSLVDKHKGRAFALAFNIIGNYEDAKDVLQEAFVKAYVSINNFRESSNFYTWFYRILVNLCRDFLRRRSTQRRVLAEPLRMQGSEEEEMFDVAGSGPDPSQAALNKETKEMVDQAINLLPEKQKIVFILRHIQEMKLNEIAQMLDCSKSTAKVHLFRAIRSLQKSLLPYLSTSGGDQDVSP